MNLSTLSYLFFSLAFGLLFLTFAGLVALVFFAGAAYLTTYFPPDLTFTLFLAAGFGLQNVIIATIVDAIF
ncbi:MAG: hypothetical protein NT028_04500 [candidate division Zixibacteria bacterium]|nr:hypothetical protein [candidate division Zixibacteria bacterium]